MVVAGLAVLGAFGAAGRTAGRFLAMAVEPPVRHLIDDVASFPTQPCQSRCQLIHEVAQRRGQVAAVVPLEAAPLVLLGVERGTVAGQGVASSHAPR